MATIENCSRLVTGVVTGTRTYKTWQGSSYIVRVRAKASTPTKPVVENVSPPVGTLLGMNTPILCDVTHPIALRRVLLTVSFEGKEQFADELVYDGTEFTAPYVGSSVSPISLGVHFVLIRQHGWPGAPTITPWAFSVDGAENA